MYVCVYACVCVVCVCMRVPSAREREGRLRKGLTLICASPLTLPLFSTAVALSLCSDAYTHRAEKRYTESMFCVCVRVCVCVCVSQRERERERERKKER